MQAMQCADMGQSELIMLQPLRWHWVECAIHHEWDVREEQHQCICGMNKQ